MSEIDRHLCGSCKSFKEILEGEGVCFNLKLPKPFATYRDLTIRESLEKARLLEEITRMEKNNSTCFEPKVDTSNVSS